MKDVETYPVKLLSLWSLDDSCQGSNIDKHIISHGIWKVNGLEIRESGKIFTLICVISNRSDLKIGETRLMSENQMLMMCHEVKIQHLPKNLE